VARKYIYKKKMSAKISKKTGEVIQPRGPNHRPTFSHIRTLARVHPERLYEDERGRLYGQHDGFWFVHLPTTPAQATVDQDVEFPEEETTATLKNLKTEEELVFIVESYPERIARGARTAVIIFKE
jgi:hypothetical protein